MRSVYGARKRRGVDSWLTFAIMHQDDEVTTVFVPKGPRFSRKASSNVTRDSICKCSSLPLIFKLTGTVLVFARARFYLPPRHSANFPSFRASYRHGRAQKKGSDIGRTSTAFRPLGTIGETSARLSQLRPLEKCNASRVRGRNIERSDHDDR